MDASEHMIVTPPMRLEPWIRHYDSNTGRDERQAYAVHIRNERHEAELQHTSSLCVQCEQPPDRAFMPTFSRLVGMDRFAAPPVNGPLERRYASLRPQGDLPVLMKLHKDLA
jgi:hypothetical protein